jgi:beta-fructofuranosidase
MTIRLENRWIWDSWYVWEGDVCHAFFLSADRGLVDPELRHRSPIVGHAISKDLVNWEMLPDAIGPSETPAFDSWTTWTGSVVRADDGTWWMFYTGSSREDGGLIQRVGAATSRDLITWEKLGTEPLVEADPTWYELLDTEVWHDQAWRDPWVFRMPGSGQWHMLVTARAKAGDPRTRGVVGHAVSDDLLHWRVREPLSQPDQGFGQLEVLQFEIVDGVPIVLFCCGWRELSAERQETFGERDATYFLVCNPDLSGLNFNDAHGFEDELVYAGRLVQGPDSKWNLLGFRNIENGEFVGEICDPIPVTADPSRGIIRRSV